MAPPPGTLRVWRYFLALLALFALFYLLVFLPGHRHTPKLGIDLAGGIQVTYKAVPQKGNPAPTDKNMDEARQILANRVNGTGVTGATVQRQGSNQLVVQIPGSSNTALLRTLGDASVLNLRAQVTQPIAPACTPIATKSTPTGTSPTTGTSKAPSKAPTAAPTSSAAPKDAGARPLTAATPVATATTAAAPAGSSAPATPAGSAAPATPAPSAAPSSGASGPPPTCLADPLAQVQGVPLPTDEAAFDKLTQTQQQQLQAAMQDFNCATAGANQGSNSEPVLACDSTGSIVYLLSATIVPGSQIKDASALAPSGAGQGGSTQWTVGLNFKSSGGDTWARYTGQHNVNNQTPTQSCGGGASSGNTPCADFVGFVLDGTVLSNPVNQEAIPSGSQTQITGNFSPSQAKSLANQLSYGALPLNFQQLNQETVSATLGTSQLHAAFLAGAIGLILVVLYSLIYYRALGLVTIASLLVSAGLTYAAVVILGRNLSYNLDLAGIAGFIVALGITADSFVVFFERLKDEVHEGRSAKVAVPRAWVRARRTILSADTVSFLAAAILYYFASADVKGFAFTLGLSTLLDVIVVFLFTHPLVSLLSRNAAFGSSRMTGLDAIRVGGITDPPAAPRRRTTRPRRVARGGRSATAVLEDAEADVADDDVVDAGEEVVLDKVDVEAAEPETVVGADRATGADTVAEAEDAAPATAASRPRRRTTPAPGSAAERAAARRARLRDQGDGKDH